ncbi:Amino Acid/Auxin Permease (AAAP) Family [Phytophthora cinnamomi]|uniref:Amino Acid/Auxin Permease (AAAP) Family n=1 Tax=Phytophthora cinnamomi TaxID=4785 RepID=UPI0035597300|nr:Amino Acid/Auxin Permease (AAAP) Family [Phytophthora cinnamomi]
MSGSDDVLCVALLFCATFGVGSMSLGSIFAAAGPVLAAMAVYFISSCNLHASVAVSKSLMVAPVDVRTFSDLGYFAFGETGRRVVLLSEWGACFLSPIAFLILGGTILLPCLFEGTAVGEEWSPTHWIIAMSLGVLPVILIPTLKAAAPLAYMGGLAAVLADVICVGYSLQNIQPSPRETQIQTNHVVQTFGTIMFATGTAIIIPPIQRQHTDPARLANLVSLTLLFITSIYLLIGVVTYYQFGCTAPATLLDQLPEASSARKLASALMLLHVTIAFPLLLNPSLFDMERYILGKDADHEVLQKTLSLRAAKVAAGSGPSKPILAKTGAIGALAPSKIPTIEEEGFLYGGNTPYFQATSPPPSDNGDNAYTSEHTYTTSDRVCSGLIRTITVWLQAFLAIMFQASFMDILSFIGATTVTMSCMIMPCLCYLRVHPIATHTFRGKCDRFVCHLTIVSSLVLGIYCAAIALGNISRDMRQFRLFQAAETNMAVNATLADEYPYCHEGERN